MPNTHGGAEEATAQNTGREDLLKVTRSYVEEGAPGSKLLWALADFLLMCYASGSGLTRLHF